MQEAFCSMMVSKVACLLPGQMIQHKVSIHRSKSCSSSSRMPVDLWKETKPAAQGPWQTNMLQMAPVWGTLWRSTKQYTRESLYWVGSRVIFHGVTDKEPSRCKHDGVSAMEYTLLHVLSFVIYCSSILEIQEGRQQSTETETLQVNFSREVLLQLTTPNG